MPKPYPREFREDVIRVARTREPDVSLKTIAAADLGISESCLANWLRSAEVEDGIKPGTTAADKEELKAAKRRISLLEQEVLRRTARRSRRAVTSCALLAVSAGFAGCSGDDAPGNQSNVTRTIAVQDPTALAVEPSGSLLVAERTAGRVRRIAADGTLETEPVATVAVRTDGQRGLVGIAVKPPTGEVYAAWTRSSDGRLVVGRVAPDQEVVWVGPRSADLANGGTLRFRDDRLLIGVGDLQQPDLLDDPDAPNGKVLSLDPAAPATQTPRVLSSGWNNPYALTVLGNGEVWVADNAPGRRPERLGRADIDAPAADLPGRRAPAALIELPDGRLAVCGYLTDELRVVERDHRGDELDTDVGDVVTEVCRTSAAVLPDSRVAVATDEAVVITQLPTH